MGQGESNGLRQGLRQRHMNLIAIGGAIGAGLFVGSGVVIQSTGPAAVISFLIAGLITVLIMRMLAEMTVAKPVRGSFYVYTREAFGNRTGFAVGWMYWYFFVIVVAVEAVAGGRIVQLWLPSVPLWVLSLALLVLLTATNLVSARSYGEFEYWFSSIKVIAIVVFLVVGVLYLCGWWPGAQGGLGNLVSSGGFAPLGFGAILAAVVPCIGFYTGAEIVTIAAAESAEPAKSVAKAMRSIVFRVVLFYVGSVFVVVAIRPWNTPEIATSPYAAALRVLGVPAVSTVMNAIVLIAVLSCLNSALYTSSRMLFALTDNGDAPRAFTKLSRSGVPRRAILLGTVVGLVSVIAAYASPDLIFDFLVNSYGAVALFVYLAIALAQVRLRKRRDPGTLRMWLFPWLSYATIALMAAVLIAMAVLPASRAQFWLSVLTLVVILIGFEIRRRRAKKAAATAGPEETDTPSPSETTSPGG